MKKAKHNAARVRRRDYQDNVMRQHLLEYAAEELRLHFAEDPFKCFTIQVIFLQDGTGSKCATKVNAEKHCGIILRLDADGIIATNDDD